MSDLFVEVDEAMKQERMEKLWQDYGGFVIGFIFVIIFGTAANAGYASWKTSKNQKQTAIFLQATYDSDKSALEKLSPQLSSLIEIKSAEEQYQEITQNDQAYKPVKQIAEYMLISKQENTPEKIQDLSKLVSDQKHPWRFHAYLDLAVLEATVNQNYTQARGYLKRLTSEEQIPNSLRQKAQSLDILYQLQETL